MKRLVFTFSALCILTLTTGCDGTVTNFIKKAKPNADHTGPEQSNSPNGIKFSPGKMEATSADIAVEATVTPTSQLLTGSGLSARVGISRTRVK